MTQEQINQLAREYAENKYKLFSDRISPIETWREVDIREFKQCVDFLLRDHLIVEKSKVMDKHTSCVYSISNDDIAVLRAHSLGCLETLENIFGAETFNPTEK